VVAGQDMEAFIFKGKKDNCLAYYGFASYIGTTSNACVSSLIKVNGNLYLWGTTLDFQATPQLARFFLSFPESIPHNTGGSYLLISIASGFDFEEGNMASYDPFDFFFAVS